MKILAFEFSTEQRSVAVVDGGAGVSAKVLGEARSDSRDVGGLTLVEQALRAAGCEREDIGVIAVGLGPGSYTGIRVAIALAQGWQLVQPVKLVGVSTAECLAEQAREGKIFGNVSFVMDAQRNEFYLARFHVGERAVEVLEPLRIASMPDVLMAAKPGEVLAGPDVIRWFPEGRLLTPDAGVLGRIAAGRADSMAGEKLEPIYLREANFAKAPAPRLVP